MILYNITVIIDEGIEQEWLNWINSVHIPEVMTKGQFVSHRLLKVLESPNEGITYCIQYIAESKAMYDQYRLEFENVLLNKLQTQFENKLVSFKTIMEFTD
ncbi:MAG TPA: DUF4286 family protein [Sphingobacteriaceae bacterium]|nr:DUF4286 family protein [Sphingobacteriaceae bacterium]